MCLVTRPRQVGWSPVCQACVPLCAVCCLSAFVRIGGRRVRPARGCIIVQYIIQPRKPSRAPSPSSSIPTMHHASINDHRKYFSRIPYRLRIRISYRSVVCLCSYQSFIRWLPREWKAICETHVHTYPSSYCTSIEYRNNLIICIIFFGTWYLLCCAMKYD